MMKGKREKWGKEAKSLSRPEAKEKGALRNRFVLKTDEHINLLIVGVEKVLSQFQRWAAHILGVEKVLSQFQR